MDKKIIFEIIFFLSSFQEITVGGFVNQLIKKILALVLVQTRETGNCPDMTISFDLDVNHQNK